MSVRLDSFSDLHLQRLIDTQEGGEGGNQTLRDTYQNVAYLRYFHWCIKCYFIEQVSLQLHYDLFDLKYYYFDMPRVPPY